MIALQQQQQPVVNNKALACTIGVHALLLLLFIFLHYTIAPPPPTVDETGGIEVNLGTSDNGSGHNQPMSTKAPAPYQATVVFKSVAAHSSIPKNIMQSTDADAPAVTTNNKKSGQAATNETGHTQEKPKYTYAGDNGPGGNSATQNMPGTNEGNGTGPGDKGVPSGTPGAANYSGTPGNGTGGIGHTLSGRTISPDRFEAEFTEGGKVVIHVTVDKNGEIVSKIVKTSSSPQLTKLALEKLKNAHFSKSDVPEQFGDITIFFTTRK
ncbi:MAG: energy transducer TonB [Chitinophagales bacterium]